MANSFLQFEDVVDYHPSMFFDRIYRIIKILSPQRHTPVSSSGATGQAENTEENIVSFSAERAENENF